MNGRSTLSASARCCGRRLQRTDPHALAQHRDYRCHASEAEIVAALTGNYRPEHVFVLQQNLELFDTYQRQLTACDTAIEAHLQTLAAHAPPTTTSLPAPRPRQKPRNNEPRFELRTPLHQLTGVDLSQLDGIGSYNALRLLSEIGTDMTRWLTDKHFTSWLTLAPQNKISGGRLLSSRTQPSANRAAAILRLAAMNLVLYQDPGAAAYDARDRTRVLRHLRQRAENLGFTLVDLKTGELAEGAVSYEALSMSAI